jgi:hypothetical protein
METPISANNRLHTRLLRDDFSGPSASFRPTAFSASQPGHSDRLFPTWSGLYRSVRRLSAIKPCHEVSSGTYSTFPKYAKKKPKRKCLILGATTLLQRRGTFRLSNAFGIRQRRPRYQRTSYAPPNTSLYSTRVAA